MREQPMLIDRFRLQPSIRFSTPSLKTLRILAFVAPVAFAVAVGLITDQFLESVLPRHIAHIAASVTVALGALFFTVWMFGVIASVQDRLQETIRLEERQRIAMKLHDDLIQCAYAVQLRLEATLSELADSVSPEARQHVDQAIQELDLIVVNVRRHIEEELD
jgi:signal transduction histidine kinase